MSSRILRYGVVRGVYEGKSYRELICACFSQRFDADNFCSMMNDILKDHDDVIHYVIDGVDVYAEQPPIYDPGKTDKLPIVS